MSKPLYIYANDTWLIIRDKKDFYRRTPISELRGLLMSQIIMLRNPHNEKNRQRLVSTIKKLRKAVARKTGRKHGR